jgi:hypothetical protein
MDDHTGEQALRREINLSQPQGYSHPSIMSSLERLVLNPEAPGHGHVYGEPMALCAGRRCVLQCETGPHPPRTNQPTEMVEFRTMQRMQLEPFVRWEDLRVFMDVFHASHDPAQVVSYNGERFTIVFP